jgi:hypothetical protein
MADVSAYRSLRIGFAERDAAAKELGEHYAAGRLELAEFEERVDRVNVARTQAELDALFTDLPRPRDRARRRVREGRPLPPYELIAASLVPLVVIALFLVVAFRAGPWIVFPLLWLCFGFGFGHRRRRYHDRLWTHTRG